MSCSVQQHGFSPGESAQEHRGFVGMQIEKTMKALYVRKLFLWPRYQGAVKDSLEKHECEVWHT